jgi:hypothetical protein
MQISSISNVAPWTAELTTNLFESKPVTSSLSTTAAHTKPAASTPHTAVTDASTAVLATQQTTSATPSKSTAHAKSESFTAPVQSSASISAANTLAGYYSAKLDGRSYSGNVEESDGTYTASVMTVPISVASGPSVDSAESNLTVVIDALA